VPAARSARLAGGFVSALLLVAARPAPQAAPDYTATAAAYVSSHGLSDLPKDETAVEPALGKAYADLDIGLFHVHYPWAALADAKRGDELKQILLGLVDLQQRWIQWLDEREPATKSAAPPVPPEIATVRRWIAGWKMESIRKATASSDASRSLLTAAGGDAAVVSALKGLAAGMRDGSMARLSVAATPTHLVLAAKRSEFQGLVAYVGWLNEEWKKMAWTAALNARTEFHVNEYVFLALETPAPDGGDPGLAMNREPTGLVQHVTQYASDRLIKSWCGGGIDPQVHTGLAVNLVIELYGENNSRVFGSGEGNKTPARNKFVRGGQSHGGKLAKINADGQWRVDKGKDYFADALRVSQTEGAKQATKEKIGSQNPVANFSLDCKDNPGDHELAVAPFLGAAAAAKEIPENFFGDYQEFLRAYRAGFVRWLSTKAEPKAGSEPRPFSRLLRACIAEPSKPFDEKAAEIYGVPVTAADATTPSLEWQFLAFIPKQK